LLGNQGFRLQHEVLAEGKAEVHAAGKAGLALEIGGKVAFGNCGESETGFDPTSTWALACEASPRVRAVVMTSALVLRMQSSGCEVD
jgi:hypothetical protein